MANSTALLVPSSPKFMLLAFQSHTVSSVRYIDRPMRPAEACLDRCGQMPVRKVLSGAGSQWPPVTSRPGGGKLPPKDLEAGDW